MAHDAKQFSVADWMPLEEAFKRIETALNSGFLAIRDLLDDLRTGCLPSTVRRISRDGAKNTFCALEPASWQQMTLRIDYSRRFIVGEARQRGVHVFLRNRHWFPLSIADG
jgi:hypothetical protein